jgi:hypothetical protein
MFVFHRRGGRQRRTQVKFMPGCLVFSIVVSIVLTMLLNVVLRLF